MFAAALTFPGGNDANGVPQVAPLRPSHAPAAGDRRAVLALFRFWVAFLLAMGPGSWPVAHGADEPVPPPSRPDREAQRERARTFSPEQRQERIREFRARHAFAGTNLGEWEKKREELKQLPPAERQARMKEWREQLQQGGAGAPKPPLSPAERESKTREIQKRIDDKLADLLARKTAGTLNPAEEPRIARLQLISRRLAERKPGGGEGSSAPLLLPPPR